MVFFRQSIGVAIFPRSLKVILINLEQIGCVQTVLVIEKLSIGGYGNGVKGCGFPSFWIVVQMVKSKDLELRLLLLLFRSGLFMYFFSFSGIGFCVISTRYFFGKRGFDIVPQLLEVSRAT